MELVARGIALERGGRRIVSDFSMRVQPGEIWVVLGPNGIGKSSLLLALAGALHPVSGTLALDARSLSEWTPKQRAARVAWQGDLAFPDFGLTVGERLGLAAAGQASDALAHSLEICDLDGYEARSLGTLSMGERQRVELAALVLRDAWLWLLDEPNAHLDMRHQVQWLAFLRRESHRGRAAVVVLHDLAQAAAIASHVVLFDGRGGVEAGPAALLADASRMQRTFRVGITAWVDGRTGHEFLAPNYREGTQ